MIYTKKRMGFSWQKGASLLHPAGGLITSTIAPTVETVYRAPVAKTYQSSEFFEPIATPESIRQAESAAIEAAKPMNKFPWASSPDAAAHIDFFLLQPSKFIDTVMGVYNSQSTPAIKANYAKTVAGFLNELNIVNNPLYIQKLNEAGLGRIAQLTMIDPGLVPFYYISSLNQDINGFLSVHLKNIESLPEDGRNKAIDFFRNIVETNMPDGWLEKASKANQVKYLQVMEPEKVEEMQIARAGLAANQQATKFMGFAILGVFVLWGGSKLLE